MYEKVNCPGKKFKIIRSCMIQPLTNLYYYYAMMKLAKVNSVTHITYLF